MNLSDLDGFTLFSSGAGAAENDLGLSLINESNNHDFSGEQQQHQRYYHQHDADNDDEDEDPIDTLFANPVQDFLMRGETAPPVKTTSISSSTIDREMKQSSFGDLMNRDLSAGFSLTDSVDLPPDLLSDCEEESVKQPDFPEPVGSNDLMADYFDASTAAAITAARKEEDRGTEVSASPHKVMTRKRSREVTPLPATSSTEGTTAATKRLLDLDDSWTVPSMITSSPSPPPPPKPATTAGASDASPKPPRRNPLKRRSSSSTTMTKSSVSSSGSRPKKLRRTQSASVASTPDTEVNNVRKIDVLFGKGGKINKHEGNLRYHSEKKRLQKEYLDPDTSKARKRELVQVLHDTVVDWGGRFLRRDDEDASAGVDRWYEAHTEAAKEKCRQALATPERSKQERAARRRMFIEKREKRKQRRSGRSGS